MQEILQIIPKGKSKHAGKPQEWWHAKRKKVRGVMGFWWEKKNVVVNFRKEVDVSDRSPASPTWSGQAMGARSAQTSAAKIPLGQWSVSASRWVGQPLLSGLRSASECSNLFDPSCDCTCMSPWKKSHPESQETPLYTCGTGQFTVQVTWLYLGICKSEV